jgi:hypothetical protein
VTPGFGTNALSTVLGATSPALGATGAIDGRRTGALSIAFGSGSAQIGILLEALESKA